MNASSRGSRPPSAVHRWLGRGALAATLVLVPQLAVPGTYAAARPAARAIIDLPAVPEPKIDKVLPYKAPPRQSANRAAAAADMTRQKLSRSRWPGAGTTTMHLRTSDRAQGSVGTLPVTLERSARRGVGTSGHIAGTDIRLRVYDHADTAKAHVNGALMALTPMRRADAGLHFSLDYSGFADAFGGSYGSRLRLVQLPSCVLSRPQAPQCRSQKPMDTRNDTTHQTLSVTLAPEQLTTSQPLLLAAAADASGGGGDYGATPLSPSATWEAGGSTGDFTWSYPLRVPPATAGPAPNLALSYSAQSVDGRTSSENNQTSVVGEGFDMTESYIERKYGSCKDDGNAGKGDLCWKYANATLVLNGKAAELVNDCDTTSVCDSAEKSEGDGGTWRLKNDDATRVEHLTGNTSNGDNNGEYWRVTTTNGTQYYFGKHRLPGWSDHGSDADDPVTNSTWTTPVFGDDADEPCHASTYAASSCNQAWKWNLDYVVDPHGNAMTYWYGKEKNNYAKNGDDTPTTSYTRAGYLKHTDYGLRANSLYTKPAAQRITYTYAQRCVATDCSSLTKDTKADWPDVPFDLICGDGKACPGKIGPTFFTRYRLTDITTSVWTGSGMDRRQVDNWHLTQNFPASGDASSPSLWLQSIQNTGKAGPGESSLPPVTFDGVQMPNHVEGGEDTLRYYKWRIRKITSETGAVLTVNYSDPQCIRGTTMPASEDANTLRCFPVYWSQNDATPQLDWFHKYVVTSTFEEDPTGGGDTKETRYSYDGGAGWGYADDDGLTKQKYRTWNQWRGYPKVTVITGDGTGPTSKTVTLYMRGLDGDKQKDGSTRREKVTDTTGAAIDDSRQYAGFVREMAAYNGTEVISDTVNTPWSHRTGRHVYDWGTTESWYMEPAAVTTRTKTSSGTRTTKVTTSYDSTYGMPVKVDDQGDIGKSGDETCQTSTYARNTADWLVQYAARVETYAKDCATTPELPDDTISDVTTGYDGQAVGAAPTRGDITSSYRLSSYTAGEPDYQKISTSAYDALGRPTAATDALGHTTKTAYTPDDNGYGPLTSTTVTNVKGYASTTEVDPAWGSATKLTDANGKTTEWAFDALGRLTAVWKPNRARSLGDTASILYTYSVTKDKATWVRTDTIRTDGKTYNTAYDIYDALLRPRQKQSPASGGGRTISETLYDDRGLAHVTNEQVFNNNTPTGALANTIPGSVPASTETLYDGAGRATASVFRVYDQERWRTATDDQGDRVAVTAAPGGSGTLTLKDARGRVTERREYAGPSPTGSDYTTTAYTYYPGGQIKTMTGPDRSVWSYTYDIRGRQTKAVDPDKGTTTTTYDDADQVRTATTRVDGRSTTLITDYDELDRPTGTWNGVKDDDHQLTKLTYDTVAKGKSAASIRYVGGANGKIYASQITGYNADYQPTGARTVLPADDPLVKAGAPQTFTTKTAYNLDGTINNTVLPAAGGLPIETVAYTYNNLGLVTSVDGSTDYVRQVAYTPYGETEQTTLGTSTTAKQLQITNRYEDGTRRLSNTHTLDQTNPGYTSDVDYAYDTAGNVTSINNKVGGPDTQCFTYDGHQRLTEAWTPGSHDCATAKSPGTLGGPAPYWNSWTYTVAGLRDTRTVHTAIGDTSTTYTYPSVTADGTGQPHTLTSSTTDGRTTSYTYDEAGNTTQRPGASGNQKLAWDSEGHLSSLTENGSTTHYLYDAAGQLMIRQGPDETVLYLPGQEVHYHPATGTFTAQRYYTAGDGTALRTNTGLSWIVDDHHGTATMIVDAASQQVTRRYTDPFGATRGSPPAAWPDDKGFLGAPEDPSTGLTQVGARQYDPQLGRFLSVDPVLDQTDLESLNGYAYADNNPVTLSDPTGLRPIGNCERGCANKDGSTTFDYLTPGFSGGWTYHSTRIYDQQVAISSGRTHTSGIMTTILRQDGPVKRVQVVFKKGPEPKPREVVFHGYAMGTNPDYSPDVSDDWIDRGKLATWQKVLVGTLSGAGLLVAVAPIASLGAGSCLAVAVACAEGAADLISGPAAGSGATAGGGAVVLASKARAEAKGAEAGLPEVATLYGPFHRKGSRTQGSAVAQMQIDSGELWGRTPRFAPRPTVQAYRGPLPPDAKSGSIEFYTTVKPKPQKNSIKGYVEWEEGYEDVRSFLKDGDDWAAIPIIITAEHR
ncbi:RHS repeat-associated core domain-containing protein [Streptomyces sp. NPDC047002]|uniref:RHS repeat-associated core domain-containing protein n=1 Tax=Streptomyces sp. NPDC047002 TaxID=3155475 RepID=UPI0034544EB5